MRPTALAAIFISILPMLPRPADAASLRVAPVTLERIAPAVSGTFRLTNSGVSPIRVQLRMFNWDQINGVEHLTPTKNVVVSPPATLLEPGVDHTVRIVRLLKSPVEREESYRLLVDELPVAKPRARQTVNFVLRYSIPIFFESASDNRPDVTWSVQYKGGRFELSATNSGAARMKVSRVEIRDARGTTFRVADGLVGYILAGAKMKWSLPAQQKRAPQGGKALLRFVSDEGVTDVPVGLRTDG